MDGQDELNAFDIEGPSDYTIPDDAADYGSLDGMDDAIGGLSDSGITGGDDVGNDQLGNLSPPDTSPLADASVEEVGAVLNDAGAEYQGDALSAEATSTIEQGLDGNDGGIEPAEPEGAAEVSAVAASDGPATTDLAPAADPSLDTNSDSPQVSESVTTETHETTTSETTRETNAAGETVDVTRETTETTTTETTETATYTPGDGQYSTTGSVSVETSTAETVDASTAVVDEEKVIE